MSGRPTTVRFRDEVFVVAACPAGSALWARLCVRDVEGRIDRYSAGVAIPTGRVPVLLFVSEEDARRLGAFDLPAAPSEPR